jgi:hypothetical protein
MGVLCGEHPGCRELLGGVTGPHGYPFDSLSISKVTPGLRGPVHILLVCLGALVKVEDLPLYQIPTQCNHADVLKSIMVNYSDLPFTQVFSHVKTHQDGGKKYDDLTRDAQLNCQMDFLTKSVIYAAPNTQSNQTKCFPLEPLCVLLGNNKVTSTKGDRLRFWVHKQLAQTRFH